MSLELSSAAANMAYKEQIQRLTVTGGAMPSIEEALERLAVTFTVRDIMVPVSSLVCAEGADPSSVSMANPDFSLIPIRQQGKLTGYFERDTRYTKEIKVNDIISGTTSLLDLVEFLEEREFAFVLNRREIDGYVHYSDLNHQLVKLTFYMILEAVERLGLDSLPTVKDSDKYLSEHLGWQRFQQIAAQYKKAGNAARSLFSYLNIADILNLAVKEGSFQLEDHVIRDMKRMRNGAAHVLANLVSDYDDVKKLADVKRESLRLLSTPVMQNHY